MNDLSDDLYRSSVAIETKEHDKAEAERLIKWRGEEALWNITKAPAPPAHLVCGSSWPGQSTQNRTG